MRPARGVALVLVLVLTMILGLLMTQLSLSTRAQTGRAQALTDLTQRRLALHSAESVLLFGLLTRPWGSARAGFDEAAVENLWRFDGEPFTHNGVEFFVQDVSGRLPLPQIADSLITLERALVAMGYTSIEAERKTLRLRDFYSSTAPTGKLLGSPIQSMDELGDLLGLSRRELELLRGVFTLYPVTQFNINSASPLAVRIRYPGFLADSVLMYREREQLDAAAVFRLTGRSTDEFTVFFPGPAFEIRARASVGDVALESLSVWVIQPYEYEPLRLWERRRPLALEQFQ